MKKGQKKRTTDFNGGVEKRASVFGTFEKFATIAIVPRIPKSIETFHLTIATLPLAGLAIVLSYLAKDGPVWLWGVCICIVVQYFTDLFDGAVGRYRNTGLITWGFLMDHLFDYIFIAALLVGWTFLVPASHYWYVFVTLITWAGIMMNAFLYFGATGTFKISYASWGPTEFRVFLIFVYACTALWGMSFFLNFLPLITGGSTMLLAVLIYSSHRTLWKNDMLQKRNLEAKK